MQPKGGRVFLPRERELGNVVAEARAGLQPLLRRRLFLPLVD